MPVIEQPTKLKPIEELLRTSANIIKIGVDVDGIVANLNDEFLRLANEMFYYKNTYPDYPKKLKKELRASDITRFDYTECTPLNNGDMKRIFEVVEKEKKLLTLKPLPDAKRVINYLTNFYDLPFATSRANYYANAKEQTFEWFDKHKIIYSKSNFFFSNKKIELSRKLGISRFIEDRAETALELAKNNIDVLLFDYPWNNDPKQKLIQEVNNHPRIERIYNAPKSYWLNLEDKLIK